MSRADELLGRDAELLWHPYSSLSDPSPARLVTGADGVRLRMTGPEGASYEVIDAMASWWCVIHGYRHPVLDAALREQADRFSHVMFGGLTHEPAVRLAERLVEITPDPLRHVFFCDSGSVSV
ncbi:MAG TPA: aminotransferase class III-fold pyridoxal phosphate-dependent enzyme, partial [Kribbellaceae bacterium]|nr:aminotransferase class III-fold pyridoxal phosphate-dependent enzyme [Kribbellaceae bacterium]